MRGIGVKGTSAEKFRRGKSRKGGTQEGVFDRHIFRVMVLLLAAGVAAGTFLAADIGQLSEEARTVILSAADRMAVKRMECGLLEYAAGSFFSAAVLLIISFVCGFCAVTAPVAAAVPFFKGLGFGIACACMYMRDGISAFGYLLVCLFPDMLFSGGLIAAGAAMAVRLSSAYLTGLFSREKDFPGKTQRRGYVIGNLFLFASAAAAALIGSAISGIYVKI